MKFFALYRRLRKRRPLAMSSSQLQPTPSDGNGHLDVSSIGRTNRLHSEEEQLHIRNVLLAAESLLQSGTVDGDLRRREETVDVIGRCKIALAPHKILPPDVLWSIFHFCGETLAQFPLGSKRDIPLLCITHVCSAWRQLALGMPTLWSNISIRLSYMDWEQHDKTLSSARQWFDRAQDMRRSLFILFYVTGRHIRTPRLPYSWEKLLEFMAQYRLEDLNLVYPINHVALKLPDHVWQSIECLRLEALNHEPSAGQQLFSNFGKLSNLRHLKIYGSDHLDGMDRVIPWHQLRTFEVGVIKEYPVTPSSCLNLLRHSRLLEHCCVTLSKESSFPSTTISTEEKVVLANMDHFKAQFRDGLAVPMFLQPLIMPNVTAFSLVRDSRLDRELSCDMPALIGIIQRSEGMHHIRHLEIDTSSAVLDIGVLLELLPSLESVSIASGHLSDNAIKRLSSGKLGLWLQSISLHVSHDADQILSMVESRYQNATQSDSQEVNDRPCPFKYISIPREVTDNGLLYVERMKLLSEKCNAMIYLDEYGYEDDRW